MISTTASLNKQYRSDIKPAFSLRGAEQDYVPIRLQIFEGNLVNFLIGHLIRSDLSEDFNDTGPEVLSVIDTHASLTTSRTITIISSHKPHM